MYLGEAGPARNSPRTHCTPFQLTPDAAHETLSKRDAFVSLKREITTASFTSHHSSPRPARRFLPTVIPILLFSFTMHNRESTKRAAMGMGMKARRWTALVLPVLLLLSSRTAAFSPPAAVMRTTRPKPRVQSLLMTYSFNPTSLLTNQDTQSVDIMNNNSFELPITESSSSTTSSDLTTSHFSLALNSVSLIRTIFDKVLAPPKSHLPPPIPERKRLFPWFRRPAPVLSRLSAWAFSVCDSNHSGKINKAELYAGILLCHIHLAKYTGVVACHPPDRSKVDAFFDLADTDGNGLVGRQEFQDICKLCLSHIGSRIIVYYTILLAAVPFLSGKVLHSLGRSHWMGGILASSQVLAEHLISLALFVAVVPVAFDQIDKLTQYLVKNQKRWWL